MGFIQIINAKGELETIHTSAIQIPKPTYCDCEAGKCSGEYPQNRCAFHTVRKAIFRNEKMVNNWVVRLNEDCRQAFDKFTGNIGYYQGCLSEHYLFSDKTIAGVEAKVNTDVFVEITPEHFKAIVFNL